MLLSDKVAIITGSAKGIGRVIILKFVEQGCALVIADVSPTERKQAGDEGHHF